MRTILCWRMSKPKFLACFTNKVFILLLSCQQKNSIMKKRKDCFDIKFWWITWSQQAPGERVEIDLDIIQCHSFRFKIAFFLLAIIPIARIIIKKNLFLLSIYLIYPLCVLFAQQINKDKAFVYLLLLAFYLVLDQEKRYVMNIPPSKNHTCIYLRWVFFPFLLLPFCPLNPVSRLIYLFLAKIKGSKKIFLSLLDLCLSFCSCFSLNFSSCF